jgi:putative ABC transport system permease protein
MLSPLNKKLLRDLWKMKGQALAIAMVVGAGVGMYVMYLSNFASLRQTQQAYYERQRFADVFASLKRAPQRVADDIAAIPGVSAFETRTVASVTLDLAGIDEPATGRLVSIPAARRPAVNDLYLRKGRWIEPGRPDEVLASEGFVNANRLEPGDSVPAVINGRRRELTIVGVALSPEYIYSIRPGELVPDDRRFGVLWMDQLALASAFDMEGGFNDVVLGLAPGASAAEAIAGLDRILEPYGGLGAIPRALQISHWTLQNELNQLQNFGFLLPLIFLMVAAFVLNVALTRALSLQRAQIAALKALGYSNLSLGWHYMKWALLIGIAGVLFGIVLGGYLGSAIGDLYNEFFRFPELLFSIPIEVVVGATLMTLGAAGLGAFSAVRRAVRIPPAEAMRPEPPARYRRSVVETVALARRLGVAGRMVLRNLGRRPLRAAVSVVGIGFAVAVLMVGFVFVDAVDRLITTQFSVAERQDVTVTFVEPRSDAARHALARMPGVIAVEPVRSVAARVRAGHRERYLAITGVAAGARMRRVVDADGREVRLTPSGVVLSKTLADVLNVTAGDTIDLEVLEGNRPALTARITGLVDDVMGLSVYMEMEALHRMMREGDVVSAALLLIDPVEEARLSRALKETPAVAGAGFKSTVLRSFRDTMAANMNLTVFINLLFAGVIAFGVVYNAARVSLSERSHELASLRVLGFTRAEISLILMEELALLTLAALPVGALFGYWLSAIIFSSVQSEVYRFPMYISRSAVALACLGVTAAALISALLVRRRLDRLDLVAVLKVRE